MQALENINDVNLCNFSFTFLFRLHEYASMIRNAIFTTMNETQVRSTHPTAISGVCILMKHLLIIIVQ